MTLEEQLRALIKSSPPHVQRHFACDCAERVLGWKGVEDARSGREIAMWRRYADTKENAEDPDALDAALLASKNAVEAAALNALYEAHRFGRPYHAESTAAAESERAWQIAHIQHLLARMQVSPSFAQTLEEALFT